MHDYTYGTISGKKTHNNHTEYLSLFNANESVFILIPENAFFKDAYYQEYNFLKEQGLSVYIGDFSCLEVEGNHVFCNGVRIDVIRRCMECAKFGAAILQLLA
jgi:hypothetical protein